MGEYASRIMRGDYISRAECLQNHEEIGRTLAAYGPAMKAMEANERAMQQCTCEYDGDARDDGTPFTHRIPTAGCPVHAEEDEDDA